MKVRALGFSMDLGFYPVVLQHAAHRLNIFSILPLLVPIWRATVTLKQQMLKRPRYWTRKPSLEVIAGA